MQGMGIHITLFSTMMVAVSTKVVAVKESDKELMVSFG